MKNFLKQTYGFFAVFLAFIIIFYIFIRNIDKPNRFIIDQKIDRFSEQIMLVTTINYNYETLNTWIDPPGDSIKCIRYHQAKKLVDNYSHIQNLKCK